MTKINRVNSISESFPERQSKSHLEELSDLKAILKHLRQNLKIHTKSYKFSKRKVHKFERNLKNILTVQSKLENKLIELRKHLKNLREALRDKRRIKRLEQKKRLQYLKQLAEVRKSVLKIYKRERKALRRRNFKAKRRQKRDRLIIRNVKLQISEIKEKLYYLEGDIVKLNTNIKYYKASSRAMNPQLVRKKIKRIKRKLLISRRAKTIQKQPEDILVSVESKKMKLIKPPLAHFQKYSSDVKDSASEATRKLAKKKFVSKLGKSSKALNVLDRSYRKSELSTSPSVQSKKLFGNRDKKILLKRKLKKSEEHKLSKTSKLSLRDMEQRASTKYSVHQSSENVKKVPKKKVRKIRSKHKEPLPIGDKRTDSDTKSLSKRFSKRFHRREILKGPLTHGDFKPPTSTTGNESEAPGVALQKPLAETKTKKKQKIISRVKSLENTSEQTFANSKALQESLESKVPAKAFDSKTKRPRGPSLSQKKFKSHFYTKPKLKKEGMILSQGNVKRKSFSRATSEGELALKLSPETVEEMDSLVFTTKRFPSKVKDKKLSSAYDETALKSLLKTQKDAITEALQESLESTDPVKAAHKVKAFLQPVDSKTKRFKRSSLSEKKLKSHFYKKPLHRRTMQSLSVPKMRKEGMILPQGHIKRQSLRRAASEGDFERKLSTKTEEEIDSLVSTTKRLSSKVKDEKLFSEYDEKFFQNLLKTQRDAIKEKLRKERRIKQELEQKMEAKAEEEEKELYRKSKAVLLKTSNSVLTESSKADNIMAMAMKSTYNLAEIIPKDVAIIDENILAISKGRLKTNFRDILSLRNFEPEENIAEHTSSTTSSEIVLKKVDIKENIVTKSDVGPEHDLEKEQTIINDDSYEQMVVRIEELIKYALAQQAAEEKKMGKKIKKIRRFKKKRAFAKRKSSEHRKLKFKAVEKDVPKIICKCCGMTDLQPGGPCCPLIPNMG